MLRRILEIADDTLNATVVGGYDRTGYLVRQKLWESADLQVDLGGKVAVVTGANAGIGFATSKALAQRGARVYMVCRDLQRGQTAVARLTGDVRLAIADLSSSQSIHDFVRDFRQRESVCHILVNNAGVLLDQRQVSVDGNEMTFAVNTLGCYLVTELLRPQLASAGGARVINVSSGGMYGSDLGMDDLQFVNRPYNGVLAYAQSKRAQVLLAAHWAERFAADNIFTASMHPGWVDTLSVRRSLPLFYALTKMVLRNPDEGADTIVWLACKPQLAAESSGRFWFDRKVRAEHRLQRTRNSDQQQAAFLRYLQAFLDKSLQPRAGDNV